MVSAGINLPMADGMCGRTCQGKRSHDVAFRESCAWAAQVHFPFPAYGNKLLAEALAQAVGEGLCRAVGVCNFGGEQLGELHGLLAQRGVPLASNQARPVQHLNLGFGVNECAAARPCRMPRAQAFCCLHAT